MISLRDCIEIHTSPRQIFVWLERMPQEYKAWHPDHVGCRILHGSMLEVGSEIEFSEYLHRELHAIRFRIVRVIPDERVEFVIRGMGWGAFEAQANGAMVNFIAELEIGSKVPVFGRIIDWAFMSLFKDRIEALRQHMAEEGRNLKVILE